jgi:hypothetical protein
MHRSYRDFYLARVESAVATARAATGITHQGLKGEIREILMRDLFRPLLPADIGVATGQVISSEGATSTQQDVVLYDRRILPPHLFDERTGLFPIESVLFTIEIKSTLNASELRSSHEAAKLLLAFGVLPGEHDAADKPIDHKVMRPLSAVFAFDTDLTAQGKSELERYQGLLAEDDTFRSEAGPPLRLLCVLTRGCWVWRKIGGWISLQPSYPFEEVLHLVSIVMNTYRAVASSSTRAAPRQVPGLTATCRVSVQERPSGRSTPMRRAIGFRETRAARRCCASGAALVPRPSRASTFEA